MIEARLKDNVVYRSFAAEVAAGRVANAYLFVGEDSVTGDAMAALSAECILCPRSGCGTCSVCRAVESGSHPDLHIYNREKKMTVADAENLVSEAQKSGWQSSRRVFSIYNAERLTPEVQNKLLKVMEEPPEGAVILMSARHENGLLPTVRSRVKLIRLPIWSVGDVEEELKSRGVPARVAEVAARLSGGSFALASAYAEEEGLEEEYDEVFSMLRDVKNTRDMAPYVYSGMFTSERIPRILDFAEIILRDVLVKTSGAEVAKYTYNRDYDIGEIAKGFSAGGAAMALLRVNALRALVEVNISAETIGEKMLFDILEAKYKWRQS